MGGPSLATLEVLHFGHRWTSTHNLGHSLTSEPVQDHQHHPQVAWQPPHSAGPNATTSVTLALCLHCIERRLLNPTQTPGESFRDLLTYILEDYTWGFLPFTTDARNMVNFPEFLPWSAGHLYSPSSFLVVMACFLSITLFPCLNNNIHSIFFLQSVLEIHHISKFIPQYIYI